MSCGWDTAHTAWKGAAVALVGSRADHSQPMTPPLSILPYFMLETHTKAHIFSVSVLSSEYCCGLGFSFTPVFVLSHINLILLFTDISNRIGAVLNYCCCKPKLSCWCCFTLTTFPMQTSKKLLLWKSSWKFNVFMTKLRSSSIGQ